MLIRDEQPADHPAVRAINVAAFDTPAEANLVDALRQSATPIISLVATDDSTDSPTAAIRGHILFSPVTLPNHPHLNLMTLAPMAVCESHRNCGIGSALVRQGLTRCKQLGAVAVVVLGHPTYYPRFGFTPASRFNLTCPYDAPDEAFMLIELQPGALNNISGEIKYHPAFADL